MILVSYDGSADAQAAIERVARLMPGVEATVLTVWEPFIDTITRTGSMGVGLGTAGSGVEAERIDAAGRAAALATATEGADRANLGGLVAQPQCAARHDGIANTILAAAAEHDADAIVMGTRGLGGVKSFLLGSVSHAVVQHADRAVLVVPSATVGDRRRERVHHDTVSA
jgi:nucleotide-binding universal stress UspA family protein